MVIEPGWHRDLDETTYHRDPDSLSASGMKLLLKAPALYRWQQDNPPEPKDHFDVGTACHSKVLGTGAPVVVIDADSKRGKAWSEPADAARAEGKVPLLRKDAEAVDRMAEAVLAHPVARKVLTGGDSELSAFWHDPEYNVTRRARFDHLNGVIAGDLKTTVSADPKRLPKTVVDYGYDVQYAQYADVAAGLGVELAAMAFVFVEKEPPHLVVVAELDAAFYARGRDLCRVALERFRDCRESGIWPGYVDEFTTLNPPRWATNPMETYA